MIFVRNWTCGICDQEVLYDSIQHTLSCGCKKVVQLSNSIPRDVLAKHYHLKNFGTEKGEEIAK